MSNVYSMYFNVCISNMCFIVYLYISVCRALQIN